MKVCIRCELSHRNVTLATGECLLIAEAALLNKGMALTNVIINISIQESFLGYCVQIMDSCQ